MRAHLAGRDDSLVSVAPVLERIPEVGELFGHSEEEGYAAIRKAERTGRPVGAEEFVTGLERLLGRRIARRAPGRKPAQMVMEGQLELLV